jgi:recombination protein RecA
MSKKKSESDVETEVEVESPITEPASAEKVIIKKHSRLDKILGSDMMKIIAKKHGVSVIRRASEHHSATSHFIPTGSLNLDWVLGGGYRVGGIHTVWGPKSSGKTTTLLLTIGNAQKMCANCWDFAQFHDEKTGEVLSTPVCPCGKYREVIVGYINVEGTWDAEWARKLGVDTNSLLLSEPEYAEQSLDIAEALIRDGNIDILALDSLAFMTPEKEVEESASKELMGMQPRVLGKGIRKFVAAMNHMSNTTGRKPTVFFTNQVRMKLGVMFGNPETQPGGMAPQFAATTELKFKTARYEIEKDKDKEAPDVDLNICKPISVLFSFKGEKNKQGTPMLEGAYRLVLVSTEARQKGTVNDETVIMDQAEKYGIIKKESNKWTCAGVPFATKGAIEETLTKDPPFRRLLTRRVMEQLLKD